MSQPGSTVIYSGGTNSIKAWSQSPYGSGFVFGKDISGIPHGETLIQSGSTWVSGSTVYISVVIN